MSKASPALWKALAEPNGQGVPRYPIGVDAA